MKYAFFPGCMIPARFPQFEAASLKVLDFLGVKLEQMHGWTCCPEALSMKTLDKKLWYTVAARNICLAEEKELDILTLCNGCNETLFEVNRELKANEQLRQAVNESLKETGRTYQGTIEVRSILRVLYENVGLRKIKESVRVPLKRTKAAVHYGCHIFPELREFDDALHPKSLKKILSVLGAEVIEYPSEMTCCAAFSRPIDEDISLEFVEQKLNDISAAGADCIVVLCPYCFLQLDLGQVILSRKSGKPYQIPVVYISQLLGLTYGFGLQEMGLNFHSVKTDPLTLGLGTWK